MIPIELTDPIKKPISILREGTSERIHYHDPSNIIKFEGRYFVWFTRNVEDHKNASTYYAVSHDGTRWDLCGEALGLGRRGQWDDSGNLAPYVAYENETFYLFYTGFTRGDLSTRHIGLARAEKPWGPWERCGDSPVLYHGSEDSDWHSDMVGDSNVLFREGKWWLYFKGKKSDEKPWETHIGVAVSDTIKGPYEIHPSSRLFDGHAFSAWNHRGGVAALRGKYWPEVLWSENGLDFVDTGGRLKNYSTGFYCPANFEGGDNCRGIEWGFDVVEDNGVRYLERFNGSFLV